MTNTISEALLADFQAEAKMTRKVLEAVPEEKLGWKPHEKSMALGQLAGHVAENPSWIGAMLEDEMDFASMAADWKPYVATDRNGLLATFDQNCGVYEEALRGREDAFLRSDWTMKMSGKVLLKEPKHEVIRTNVIHHGAHHRGQLTVYLRLLDVPVPATYGPTADFPEFG